MTQRAYRETIEFRKCKIVAPVRYWTLINKLAPILYRINAARAAIAKAQDAKVGGANG